MAKKATKTRTPARIMADMIECAMQVNGESRTSLAKKMHICLNTVCSDLKDPERIPQNRLWLYFTALRIPMNEPLQAVADRFAAQMIGREEI